MLGQLLAKWGRCCGHSAPINCHQVYDSAVAERVLSVHYHSSIAFSRRDVRLLRQDLSQTLWIFIRRCRFPHIQPGDTKPVQSSGLLKKVKLFNTDQLSPSTDSDVWFEFGRLAKRWLDSPRGSEFYLHLYDAFPNENLAADVYAKKSLLSAARLISSPCVSTFTRQ